MAVSNRLRDRMLMNGSGTLTGAGAPERPPLARGRRLAGALPSIASACSLSVCSLSGDSGSGDSGVCSLGVRAGSGWRTRPRLCLAGLARMVGCPPASPAYAMRKPARIGLLQEFAPRGERATAWIADEIGSCELREGLADGA